MAKLLTSWLLVDLFIIIFALNLYVSTENHYVYLSDAFLNQSLSFVKIPPTITDVTYFQGKFFWTNGPFPSIILLPFVWVFGINFPEPLIKTPLTLLNFWLVYKIAKILKLSSTKSVWLAIFYIFGSIYTPVASFPFSSYLSGIIANSLLLFAIYEFLSKKRWFIIGIALALAILTRFPPILAPLFFTAFLSTKPRITNTAKFILPVACAIIFLGLYNYVRFGSVFETGHKYQLIPEESTKRRAHGVFSLEHVPANLYYLLIKTPDPVLKDSSHVMKPPYLKFDNYGLSIFFLSPLLFLIIRTNFREKYVIPSIITIFAMLIPITTYYSIGYKQIGYWYAIDVFPFLLFPLISALKRTDQKYVWVLVLIGAMITWFFITQFLIDPTRARLQ